MLILKTLGGDEIGRCKEGIYQWDKLCRIANNRMLTKDLIIGNWYCEDVYEDDGYSHNREFMTLDGRRYFEIVVGK